MNRATEGHIHIGMGGWVEWRWKCRHACTVGREEMDMKRDVQLCFQPDVF